MRRTLIITALACALAACSETGPSTGGSGGADPTEWNGSDIDCDEVDGPVVIDGSDPNGLDGDGIGCEPSP
jgi:hypothetical protein